MVGFQIPTDELKESAFHMASEIQTVTCEPNTKHVGLIKTLQYTSSTNSKRYTHYAKYERVHCEDVMRTCIELVHQIKVQLMK